MKKNIAALVLAILGAIAGVVGGIMWAACADACADVVGSSVGYTVGFILLGIGGAVLSLVGGIQAFTYKKGRVVLSVFGLLFEVGALILQCVFIEGFEFVLSMWTMFAIILLFIETILAARKA